MKKLARMSMSTRLLRLSRSKSRNFARVSLKGSERLSTKDVTMAESKKTKSRLVVASFNTELIFSRVLYLLGNNQLDFTTPFNYELSPVPTSMFHDSGETRYPESKAVLKSKLKVEVSVRGVEVDVVVASNITFLPSFISHHG